MRRALAVQITAPLIAALLIWQCATVLLDEVHYQGLLSDWQDGRLEAMNESELRSALLQPVSLYTSPKHLQLNGRILLAAQQRSGGDALLDAAANEYTRAMQAQPAWPYHRMGLANAQLLAGQGDPTMYDAVMQLGPGEARLFAQMADVLFYLWPELPEAQRTHWLEYVSRAHPRSFSAVFTSALRNNRVYELCDHMQQQMRVIPQSCERSFWRPLPQ